MFHVKHVLSSLKNELQKHCVLHQSHIIIIIIIIIIVVVVVVVIIIMVLFLSLVSIFSNQFNFHQGIGEEESGIINLLDQRIWGNLQQLLARGLTFRKNLGARWPISFQIKTPAKVFW